MASEGEAQIATIEEAFRAGLDAFVKYAQAHWKAAPEEMTDEQNPEDFCKGWNQAMDSLDGCLESFFNEYNY